MTNFRVFVDIETTGTENSDIILEVGMVVCVNNRGLYTPLESKNWLLRFTIEEHAAMPIEPIVEEMHQKNNLWGECATSLDAFPTYYSMQDSILHWMHDQVGNEESPMCGSGVHFDRAFIKRFMPKVEKAFHYRIVDASTLRTLYKDAVGDLPYDQPPAHRAVDDCYSAINDVNFFTGLLAGANAK